MDGWMLFSQHGLESGLEASFSILEGQEQNVSLLHWDFTKGPSPGGHSECSLDGEERFAGSYPSGSRK